MWSQWNPEVECSTGEKQVLKISKKQKFWSFLRLHRHLLVDNETRETLRSLFASGSRRGAPPVAPERLLMAMLLQVAFGVPDHEVPTLTAVDRRWQMVLDCTGAQEPVVSQATVFAFRERIRRSGFMDHFLEKTVRMARESGGFSAKRLRALIDSSPLLGAGRVEDTFNLLGRAMSMLVDVVAAEAGIQASEVAEELALSIVGASSIKAALDLDWRQPAARNDALQELLQQFGRLSDWLQKTFPEDRLSGPPIGTAVEQVQRIIDQDTVPDPDGSDVSARILRVGTAAERQISLSDPDMRHGRKSKSNRFNGYKRHVAMDADVPGLILGAEVRPANRREYEAAAPLVDRLEKQGFSIVELQIDRGYLAAPIVHRLRANGAEVITKPPAPRQGVRYQKYDFKLDTVHSTLTCPSGTVIPFKGDGENHRFPAHTCRQCLLRERCLTPKNQYGKALSMHEHETFFREMHRDLSTPEGRARRRTRTAVEHGLARIGSIQGRRATFRGLEKNQFDLVRTSVVANLHVLNGLWSEAA